MRIHITLFLVVITLNGFLQGSDHRAVRDLAGNNVTAKSHLELILDDLQILSGITNAIALQASAIRNTFKVRDVIADLMHLNPSNFSELIRHDTSPLNVHLDKIVGRYKKIADTFSDKWIEELEEISEMILELHEGMNIELQINESTISEFFEYLNKSETEKTLKVGACDENLVGNISNFWNIMNNHHGVLTDDDQKKSIKFMKSIIPRVKSCTESLQEHLPRVNSLHIENLKIFEKILFARDKFKIFKKKTSEYSNFNASLSTLNEKIFKEVLKNWKTPEISVFKFISDTRDLRWKLTDKEYIPEKVQTLAFVTFGSLLQVQEDVKGKWFTQKIAHGKSTKELEHALKPFYKFGGLVEAMAKKWIKMQVEWSKDDVIDFLDLMEFNFQIIDEFQNLEDIGTGTIEFLEKIKEIYEANWKDDTTDEKIFKEFDKEIDKLIILNNTVFEILEWVDQTVTNIDFVILHVAFDELAKLDIGTVNLKDTKELIQGIPNFGVLNQFCERFSTLSELQTTFLDEYKPLKNDSVPKIISETLETLKQSQIIQNLGNLKEKRFDAERLLNLTEFVKSIRRVSDLKEAERIQTLINHYSEFRSSFIHLEYHADNYMNASHVSATSSSSSEYQNPVLKLKDPMKVSHTIAQGTTMLRTIVVAYKQKELLLNSTKYSKEVNDHIAMFNKNDKVRRFWNSEKSSIQKLIKDMDQLNEFSKKIRDKDILTIREIYDKSSNLTGFKDSDDLYLHIYDQLESYNSTDKNFKFALENAEKLENLELDFSNFQGHLLAASLGVQDIKDYFDELFGLAPKEEKIVANDYLLVTVIAFIIFFIIISCVFILYGCSQTGRRQYKNLYLFYFGKPEDFEKRWRYSRFMDRQDGANALIDAVREINPSIVLKVVKKGAYINVYNDHGNTPLHVATKRGYYEIVDILIRHGADRTLLNAQNKTPEQMISLQSSSHQSSNYQSSKTEKSGKFEKIDQIYKKYQNKKFRVRVPEVFPVSSFHIYAEDRTDVKLTNKFMETFKSIATTEALPTTTHCIVKTEPDGTLTTDDLDLLVWILNGVIIVKDTWMSDCLKDEKLIGKDWEYLVEKVKYKGIEYDTIGQWTQAMAKGQMPFLYGVYVAIVITDHPHLLTLISIVTRHGGTFLEQFPEKQNFNIGSHPYLHAHLGPLFIIHDGQTDLDHYKNDRDKMYTFFTEEEFMHFMLKREINVDKSVHPIPVLIESDD